MDGYWCRDQRGHMWELVHAFYHVGSRNGTQIVRPGSRWPYLLSYLPLPLKAKSVDLFLKEV